MPTYFQITSYIKHKLREIDEHSLHSPSMFRLYLECFKKARDIPADMSIEKYRQRFIKDKRSVNITDFGAGSKISVNETRTVRSIAKGGISTSKYSRLFQELIRYFKCRTILELGTSIGINTLYLATSGPDVKVWTFEGCQPLAGIAEKTFMDLGQDNIKVIIGNIDSTLPRFLHGSGDIDFAFIDANHTYRSTMSYFNLLKPKLSDHAVVIIDDIYWSKEMAKAWHDISKHNPDAACIDIFQCGIIIFDRNLSPQSLRFEF
ncbi:MAG: class I SAM-dependent methyltransferase [Cyclobacteriaceae bacterium]